MVEVNCNETRAKVLKVISEAIAAGLYLNSYNTVDGTACFGFRDGGRDVMINSKNFDDVNEVDWFVCEVSDMIERANRETALRRRGKELAAKMSKEDLEALKAVI